MVRVEYIRSRVAGNVLWCSRRDAWIPDNYDYCDYVCTLKYNRCKSDLRKYKGLY